MIDEKVFNKEITHFINEFENQNVTSAFKSANFRNSSYYDFLDWFTFDLGFSFMNIEVVDERNHEKTLGFYPKLRIHNDNVLNLKEEDILLSYEWLDLKTSSSVLAKNVIRKVFGFERLETFVKQKNYKF